MLILTFRDLVIVLRALEAEGSVGAAEVKRKLLDDPSLGFFLSVTPSAKTRKTLTEREQRVLTFIINGKTSKEIAEEIQYSLATVKRIKKAIMDAFGAESMSQVFAEIVSPQKE